MVREVGESPPVLYLSTRNRHKGLMSHRENTTDLDRRGNTSNPVRGGDVL